MEKQQCPNCAAPLKSSKASNGMTRYKCEYCGYKYTEQPATVTDRAFAFVNRVVNVFKDNGSSEENMSPELRAKMEQIREKERQYAEKIRLRDLQAYEKQLDRWNRKK